VRTESAHKSLPELIAAARANPDKLTFASASTSQRVSSEMLFAMTGAKLTYVPYKSGPAAMTDLIGGQVDVFTADFAVMLPQVKGGKVRGLAVTSTQRSRAIPELPTVNEVMGLKDYELIAYFALFAPAGTPPEVIDRLNRAANIAANDKEILEKFSSLGFETAPGTPQALAERSRTETAKWAKAIREAGIQPE
jgi:tripartite-type tricarboxylate transporter receptor subunit TctC